jgi:alanyl aminopeptidase
VRALAWWLSAAAGLFWKSRKTECGAKSFQVSLAVRAAPFALLAGLCPAAPSFLLPDDAVPVKYRAELTIDPSRPTFDGSVQIDIELRRSTSLVWINGKDLTVEEASVAFGGRTMAARVEASGGEFLGVKTESSIGPGKATISVRYRGHLDDKLVVGAFRRKVEGNWYAYTTFTPIEARRAFPCFDEPRFKTPWEVSLRVPADNFAFSNAAETGETKEADGSTLVHFAPTQPLPTELVAFAVGPFNIYDGQPVSDGTPVRVLTPKGHVAEGKAAAEATRDVLPKLEAYTGIDYPFGKLDHVSLADAGFGAVENPGLIVYLARELLVAPGSDTAIRTRALRALESHEIGHQWFGDMVTQSSWTDVWLSEGFATWISAKIMDMEQSPERAHLAAIVSRERIMRVDESSRTRPVRVEVTSRNGAKDIYNRTVYDKGASVLLMLDGWLGEQRVRDGMRVYLNQHRFANASTADLAAALKNASGVDPAPVLHSFLDTTGVPHVSMQVECLKTPKLTIRQTGASAIPVCYRGGGLDRSCTVLNGSEQEIDLPACPEWVYANAGGTGYYRTSWSAAQLATLPLEMLTPAERLTLAQDLKASKNPDGRALLVRLASDPQPEIAAAARETPVK